MDGSLWALERETRALFFDACTLRAWDSRGIHRAHLGVRSPTSEGGEEFDPGGDDALLVVRGEQVAEEFLLATTSAPSQTLPQALLVASRRYGFNESVR